MLGTCLPQDCSPVLALFDRSWLIVPVGPLVHVGKEVRVQARDALRVDFGVQAFGDEVVHVRPPLVNGLSSRKCAAATGWRGINLHAVNLLAVWHLSAGQFHLPAI